MTESSEMRKEPDIQPESTDGLETAPTSRDESRERVEALEEGIRLAEINRQTALGDLESWRRSPTTDSSHFEYKLPEIQNRISRAEHSISSSRLDIDLINSGAESPEQEDEVVKRFIADQVMNQRTAGLRNQLSSFDKREQDFNARMDRNHRTTEKLQTELEAIDTAIESGGPDLDRLKRNRRSVMAEMSGVSDRYEALASEKADIEALANERVAIQSQIDAIRAAGVADSDIPTSIVDDPNFAACLQEAQTHSSEDDYHFKINTNYDPEQVAISLFRKRFPQKSAYYDRVTNRNKSTTNTAEGGTQPERTEVMSNQPIPERSNETAALSQGPENILPNEITKDTTLAYIEAQKVSGLIEEKPDFEKLMKEPIIDSSRFNDVEPSQAREGSFELVEVEHIVGRPNADAYEAGWAYEYHDRQGRIAEIVTQINHPEDPRGIENIFHIESQTNERIKVASYAGPAGPIYTVLDGTHRIAGIKASGLKRVPVEVFKTTYPCEQISYDQAEMLDWQNKIKRGFIKGTIKSVQSNNGIRFVLQVQSEMVPWIRSRNQNDIFNINQIYEKKYPGALEKIGFPREALIDRSALWAFIDGTFDAWKKFKRRSIQPDVT